MLQSEADTGNDTNEAAITTYIFPTATLLIFFVCIALIYRARNTGKQRKYGFELKRIVIPNYYLHNVAELKTVLLSIA
jgi:hypothetical protein